MLKSACVLYKQSRTSGKVNRAMSKQLQPIMVELVSCTLSNSGEQMLDVRSTGGGRS